ncbi:FUSC family protein [Chelatococcus sp. GCM10030263]|uniref:FUSC family protein n=1 Tax=Chelatococcus sp. GCM10030263 TaxID=3273387 RepID=UPI00360AB6B7
MSLPSWRDWAFSAKAFLASMLALYIALWFDLPRPYWAMAAVYVVANPLAGATSSKGLYRALGTLIGAAASVFFVPLLVNSPELLSLAVALWTGTLLYISMLDRTPRSYVFMLAGYSLPLIALPGIGTPETIFDTALARSEEIIIGITCASIVNISVFPMSVGKLLSTRIRRWLDDAAAWAADILRGEGATPATPLKRQQLATDIAGLDLLISQLSYDAGARDVDQHARQLRGRLMMLLPLFSSLADRLHALKADGRGLPSGLAPLLGRIADWLKGGAAAAAQAQTFHADIAALKPAGHSFDWHDLILSSALSRLKEIVDLWADCLSLHEQIANGRPARGWRPKFVDRPVVASTRYYDYGLMLFSAGSVVVSTFVACAIWILIGWQNGASFVMLAAVASSFFAAQDRPAPFIFSMCIWCAVSLLASFVYLFGILPAIHGYEMLVVVFAVPFLILGTLIPRPQFNLLAMLMTVNTASFIALQNRYGADFTTFANEAIAALGGVGFALVWTLIARPFGAELAARRLVRAGWADLAETAAGTRLSDHEKLAGRMLDRLAQLVPRLAAIEDRDLGQVDGYAEVRMGFNILVLQREGSHLARSDAAAVGAVLTGIAHLFQERLATGRAVAPSPDLLADIDQALWRLSGDGVRGREAVDALVGLRRALFPHAPAPHVEDGPASAALPIAAE